MTSDDWFRVQVTSEETDAGAPNKVPCGFLEPLRRRIESVHSQPLERLSDRGGLSPVEIFCHFDAALLDSLLHRHNFWLCLNKVRISRGTLDCARWLGEAVPGWADGSMNFLVVP